MFGLGIFGWIIVLAAVGVVVVLAHHFRPATGRHAFVSNRIEAVASESDQDVEETIILGDLFGTDVINGYRVGEDSSGAGPRPYLEYYWRHREEQTTEIAAFGWFDGEQKENNSPALAMIG